MLWKLKGRAAEQLFKSWNTCVKLLYMVPRNTFTYLVEGFLAGDQTTFRNQILSRYPGFYRKLLTCPSKEVRVLARMVSADPRPTTCANLKYLREITNQDQVEWLSSWRVRDSLPVQRVPEKEMWRLGLLESLLGLRSEKYNLVQDTKTVCTMIDFLCST